MKVLTLNYEKLEALVARYKPLVVSVGLAGDYVTWKEVFRGRWLTRRYPASFSLVPSASLRLATGETVEEPCWCPETPSLKVKRKASEAVPYSRPRTPTIAMMLDVYKQQLAFGQEG